MNRDTLHLVPAELFWHIWMCPLGWIIGTCGIVVCEGEGGVKLKSELNGSLGRYPVWSPRSRPPSAHTFPPSWGFNGADTHFLKALVQIISSRKIKKRNLDFNSHPYEKCPKETVHKETQSQRIELSHVGCLILRVWRLVTWIVYLHSIGTITW